MGTFARRAQIALSAVLMVAAASRVLDAQTYLYNQATFAVGENPVAAVAVQKANCMSLGWCWSEQSRSSPLTCQPCATFCRVQQ